MTMNVLDRTIEIKIQPIDIDAQVYDEDSNQRELLFVIGNYLDRGGEETVNYNKVVNKPKINDVELVGNKTAALLGLQPTLTIDATPTEDSTNPVQSGGMYSILERIFPDSSLFGGFVTEYTPVSEDKRLYFLTEVSGDLPNFELYELPDNGKWKIIRWNPREAAWDWTVIDSYTSDGVSDALQNTPTIYYTQDIALIPPTIFSRLKVGDFVKYGEEYEAIAIVAAIADGRTFLYSSNGVNVDAWIYSNGDVEHYLFYLMDFVVRPSNPTAGHLAELDTFGDLVDSGIATSDVSAKYTKPSTGIPKTDLASDVQTSLGKADTALQSYTETDPTVPSWAKQSSKPTYTASEVGAVSDVTVGGTSVVTNGVAVVPSIPTVPTISTNVATDKADNTKTTGAKAVYDEVHPPLASTMPSSGFLPNIEYNLGTLNADTTFLMAAATDNTIGNIWYWVFETPSTTLNITFPSAIEWNGGNPPTIDPSKHYEITVKYNVGAFIVTDIPS